MINVLLVDDHHLFREGIARLLKDAPGITMIASAQNGEDAVALAAQHHPDVILMDVHMPGMDGIEATRQIHAAHPQINILMLTVSENDKDLFAALRCGARGYLLKDTTSQELIEGIHRAYDGQAIINPRMTTKLLDEFNVLSQNMPARSTAQMRDDETENLTSREREVLRLVARGLSNKEIGEKLAISPHTVKTHLSNTLEKLGLHGRVEAAAWAIRHGLLKGD